jgi:hypothetical protein
MLEKRTHDEIAEKKLNKTGDVFRYEGGIYRWDRVGDEWLLISEQLARKGTRVVGKVVQDKIYPGMWRTALDDGLTGMVTLARAKDAALGFLGRVDAYTEIAA